MRKNCLMKKGGNMKKLVSTLILCFLFLIACADTNQKLKSSSSTYDGILEGYAQTPEGIFETNMEIKNGIMSGFVEDTKIEGYINADNKLFINPFYFNGTGTRIIGETNFMSPDRIEGAYTAQATQTYRYEWVVVKSDSTKSDIPLSQVKVNEKEPWTGKYKVESSSIGSGIWAMKQDGNTIKSTRDSAHEFKGKVQQNQLRGQFEGAVGHYYPLMIKMSPNRMSFIGTLDWATSNINFLKGKRIE